VSVDPGNYGVTSATPIQWLHVAVIENYAGPEALANGPLVNDTVTGTAAPVRPGKVRP
jgi:hypothetical protein